MPRKKKIIFVFGTRPEAIKMAPVIKELSQHQQHFLPLVVVTGQHREMLDQVLKIFKIKPDYDLNIMTAKQTFSQITVKALLGLEEIYRQEKPDLIVVQGDTTTTFVAGLTAFYEGVPLAHIEAGLRTGDKTSPYPEEMNRTLTTDLADIHFAPTTMAVYNLRNHGVNPAKIFLTGNTVIDALKFTASRPYKFKGLSPEAKGKKIIVVTAHRRESFGPKLLSICKALKKLAQKRKDIFIVFPVHKNPVVREAVEKILKGRKNIQLLEPLDYEPFVHLMKLSYLILTDSGGIQEEAPSLGKPVLVLRNTTERPEAVMANTVRIVGTSTAKIIAETEELLDNKKAYELMAHLVNPYGDGNASERIGQALLYFFEFSDKKPEEFVVRD